MTGRLRSESGQALVVASVFMVVLIGAVAMTLDVGSWFRQHRQAQTTADAAALAAAQSLPSANTATASASAQSYAAKNGGGIDASGGITFRSDFEPNDTVVVKVTRTAPGFFSKLFSIDSANVHATAAARSGVPQQVIGVAPIVVSKYHPDLYGTAGCPCFNKETTIQLARNGTPGAFDLLDLADYATWVNGKCGNSPGGNDGSKVVGGWIQSGFNAYLDLGCYDSDTGAKFNSSSIDGALSVRAGSTLLFPVFDPPVTLQGSTAQYHIIGWAAFYVEDHDAISGNSGWIKGYFTNVIWDGIQSASGPSGPDFGVHSIALVN
jgi:hypothetical protein